MKFTHGMLGFVLTFSVLQVRAEVTELDTAELESTFIEGMISSKEKQGDQKELTENLIETRTSAEGQVSDIMASTVNETLLAKTLAKNIKLPTAESAELFGINQPLSKSDLVHMNGVNALGQPKQSAYISAQNINSTLTPEDSVFSPLFNAVVTPDGTTTFEFIKPVNTP